MCTSRNVTFDSRLFIRFYYCFLFSLSLSFLIVSASLFYALTELNKQEKLMEMYVEQQDFVKRLDYLSQYGCN